MKEYLIKYHYMAQNGNHSSEKISYLLKIKIAQIIKKNTMKDEARG